MVSTKKVVLGAVTALIGVTGAGAAAVAVTMPDGVDTPGAALAELWGHRETDSFAAADDAPDGWLPGWVRGSDVVVVRPGDASGEDDGSVRADLVLDPGTELPADCTERPTASVPWDGGGSWPDLAAAPQLECDGWVTVLVDDHLYLWGQQPT
ncbi:hypothetical protein GCM10023328_05070 [Modestobacter marinus]|uniref:Secreted protein n=1 Tax=Modestobacter marinus TaxID=477641 RepID=A0A846LIG2_9ACTN|nr:hypothetical protein [Modestobacter marinus]NIH67071.1 hypothetical protein [Modestobacter marinus]GGL51793.1 hypothetical protein GCM10011589_04890 [Modestobacter marinus]